MSEAAPPPASVPQPRERGDLRQPMPDDPLSKRKLRLWIRMLAITRRAETRLRDYLRREHDTTLPRFDVMAALWRRGEPVTMTELSRMLLVSNGNVTAVCTPLEAAGLIARTPCEADRRTVRVALTDAGRARFAAMAEGHEAEISDIFAQLDGDDLDALRALMKKLG